MDLLSYAKTVADHIEAAATRAKVPMAVCLIDVHGNVILHHRMTGAPAFSIGISEGKAYTSALIGMPTADIFPMVQPGQPLFALMSQARYCVMGGGAPLVLDGTLVGGVGISGGTVDQDMAVLEAGLRDAGAIATQDRAA